MRSKQFSLCPPLRFQRWLGRKRVATLIFLVFVILPAASQTLLLQDQKIDVGTVAKGAVIKKDFVVKNSGTADLHILSVKPACSCAVAEFDKLIKPGAEGKITLTVDTKSYQGSIAKIATVVSDDPLHSPMTITIIANVKAILNVEPSDNQQFGLVLKGQTMEKVFTLKAEDGIPFDVTQINAGDPALKYDLKPAADKRSAEFRVTLPPDHAVGAISGRFTLATTHPKAPTVILGVFGTVREHYPTARGETAAHTQGTASNPASPPTSKMTNDEVIQLVKAGLSEQVVATSVRQAPAKEFDLTPTGLIALKKGGVPDAVIAAMQESGAPAQAAPASEAKPQPKYDAALTEPPEPAVIHHNPCEDIDYLGVIQAVTGGGQMAGWNAYGGRVRNRASYTKEVEFSWVMNGRAETGTFRIPAGQFIDVNLGQGHAPPTNVQVVTCR